MPEDQSKVTVSDSIKSPNLNKSAGSVAGATGGATVGIVTVAVIHAFFKIDISPELAAAIGAVVTGVLGTVGTFLAPLITAAQQAALRKLENEGN